MGTPGFTGDSSLYRSRRQYRTGHRGSAPHGSATITPQQDDGALASTCCGKNCIGMCICTGGVGKCAAVGAIDTPRDQTEPPRKIRLAADSVAMAVDFCHASLPVTSSDGTISYAAAACPCGCWATSHDAGCFSCLAAAADTEPLTILPA
jgi:hypothetical protein